MYEPLNRELNKWTKSVSKLLNPRRKQLRRNQLRQALQLEALEYRALMAGDVGQDLAAFAKQLANAGVKFYGADWNAATKEQRNLFGDAAVFLPFVEATKGDRSFNDVANTNGITTLPTWTFANSSDKLVGVQTLEALATKAGIAIPQGSNPIFNALGANDQILSNNATINVEAGAPLWLPLDGIDPTNQNLTYTVTSSNPNIIQATLGDAGDKSARIAMDGFGDMVFRLFSTRVPDIANQFINLAQSGKYNSTATEDSIFHRVVKDFVIQAGQIADNDATPIDDNFDLDLQHTRAGLLSYAKAGDSAGINKYGEGDFSNGSEFFVTANGGESNRRLDFNHSVFGVLVEGELTRAGIDRTAVNGQSPINKAKINSISIFDDKENGVVMLKAMPNVTSGSSVITIRVADPDGNSFEQSYTVNVTPDQFNGSPFIEKVAPITAQAGVAKQVTLPVKDAEGDTNFTFTARVIDQPGATATVSNTGVLTITPPANFVGSFEVLANVAQANADTIDPSGDAQLITVNVKPGAPTSITLDPADDSGVSNSDRITNDTLLHFTVGGLTTATADKPVQVTVFAQKAGGDRIEIGQGSVTEGQSSVIVAADIDSANLTPGVYTISAFQTIDDVDGELFSSPNQITFDNIVADITPDLPISAEANVPFVYDAQNPEEGQQGFKYTLETSPPGMTINQSTGEISWTPTSEQFTKFFDIRIKATDAAGNENTIDGNVEVNKLRSAEVTLVPVDANGNTLTTIPKNTDFFLEVRVRDLRPQADAKGVKALYLDINYDATLVSVTGDINHGSVYTQSPQGSTSTAGSITSAGGTTTNTGLGTSTSVLMKIPMRSIKSGNLTFTASEANSQTSTAFDTSNGTELNDDSVVVKNGLLTVNASFTLTNDLFGAIPEDSKDFQLDVLANDTPGSGDVLTITNVAGMNKSGAVTISADGKKLLYSPAANFFGEETFRYTVRNQGGDTATATVTVQVLSVNDPPSAVDDTKTVAEDAPETDIAVLVNDNATNPDTGEGTPRITAVGTPDNRGTVRIESGNIVKYRPAPNFFGVEKFTYTITDDGGATATATVTVTVTPVNDAPKLFDAKLTVLEDSDTNVLSLDSVFPSNPDAGVTPAETLTVTAVGTSTNASVTLVNGKINYKPNANFQGTDVFTYTMSDGTLTATNTITVTVTNVNDPPTAVADTATTAKNTAKLIDVLANDTSAPDPSETLTISAVGKPANGTATISGSSINYVPNTGFSGTDTFTYTLLDSNGGTATGTVTVTVSAFTPSTIQGFVYHDLSDDGSRGSSEPGLGNVTITLSGKDSDGKDVSKTAVSDATGHYMFSDMNPGSYKLTQTRPAAFTNSVASLGSGSGSVTDANTMQINITSENTQVTEANFGEQDRQETYFRLFERFGSNRFRTSVAAISTGSNVVPVFTQFGSNSQWSQYKTLKFTLSDDKSKVTINATDANNVRFSATVPTSGGPVRLVAPAGNAQMLLYLPDDPALLGLKRVGNAAPSFTIGSNQTVNEDAAKTTVNAWASNINRGSDEESSQTLSFTLTPDRPELFSEQPAVDSTTGNLTFKVADNANGVAVVKVRLKDNGGTADGGVDTSAEQTFTITVNAVNDVPSFTKGADQTNTKSTTAQPITVSNWATKLSPGGPPDEATQTLTFDVQSVTNNSLFSVAPTIDATGKLSYTLAANQTGSSTVTVRLKDSGGTANGGVDTSASQTFTITVSASGGPPVAGNDTASVNEDANVTINVGTNDSDPDNNPLTRSVVTNPTNGTVVKVDESNFKYTPNANFFGSDTFVYKLDDGQGNSVNATVTITVNPVNDAPTFDLGSNISVANNSGTTTRAQFATNLNRGAPNESDQTLTFVVTPSNATLFNDAPAISPSGTLIFTPKTGVSGVSTISVKLTDNGGTSNGGVNESVVKTFTITITDPSGNIAPPANNDSATTNEDVAVSIDIAANDGADPNGDTVTRNVTTAPTHGSAVKTNDTKILYTPNLNYFGTDTFVYTASDGKGGTSTATVTITINAVNDAPVAGDDSATTPEDTSVTINPASNDSDVDGDTLTRTISVQPQHGTVVRISDTEFRYSPNLNYNGTDTFVYTASDGKGGSDTATVTITVTPVNDAPQAVNDSASTAQGTVVTINVAANDPADVDGDTVTRSVTTQPTHGSVEKVDDSKFKYTPTGTFTGTDTFVYTSNDGHGGTATATVTITIGNNVNDPPTAGNDTLTVLEDANGTIDVSTNDSDPDADPLTRSVTTQPLHGDVVKVDNNNFKYTPDANFSGTDSFVYTADDGHGGTATATVTITITPVNDTPSFNVGANQVVAQGSGAQSITNWATAINAGGGDDEATQTFTFLLDNDHPELFDVAPAISPSGTLTFTPKAGVSGVATISARVQDSGDTSNGGENTSIAKEFTITINGAPTAGNDTAETNEDVLAEIDVSTNDSDPENDTLTRAVGTQGKHGAVTKIDSKTFKYVPETDFNGQDTFTYTMNDGNGNTVTATVTVNVNAVNDVPSFTAGPDQNVAQGAGAVTVDNWATKLSPGGGADEASQTLAFVVLNDREDLFDVTPTISSTGKLSFTPKAGQNGVATLTVRIQDNGGVANGGSDLSEAQFVTITVNGAPTASDDSVNVNEDSSVTINVVDNDTDPENDALTLAITTQPAHGVATKIDNTSIKYEPSANYNGDDTFTYTITDTAGNTSTATVTITVDPLNDAPTFDMVGNVTVEEDAGEQTIADWATKISAGPSDESTQFTQFEVLNIDNADLVGGGILLTEQGTLVFTPADNASGQAVVRIRLVDDGDTGGGNVNASVERTFTITVTPVNDEPSLFTIGGTTTEQDTPHNFTTGDVTINDIDAGTNPVKMTMSVLNGKVSLAPAALASLTFTTGDGTDDTDLVFTGTLSAIQAALNGMVFTPDTGFVNDFATINFELNDQGNTGSDGALTATGSIDIEVTSPAPAPAAGIDAFMANL